MKKEVTTYLKRTTRGFAGGSERVKQRRKVMTSYDWVLFFLGVSVQCPFQPLGVLSFTEPITLLYNNVILKLLPKTTHTKQKNKKGKTVALTGSVTTVTCLLFSFLWLLGTGSSLRIFWISELAAALSRTSVLLLDTISRIVGHQAVLCNCCR
jgi:hypothetical protein